eukprot:TRINITY_DN963_c0_g1_i2.p1 TRINITY_DN963_c0_g1~~TRINITY_DN963_c0_g1_i2.p1  ORF type:complete len:1830 (+),score=713.93 TRINITY_DN963_c0_g1_i2:118-5607(+)
MGGNVSIIEGGGSWNKQHVASLKEEKIKRKEVSSLLQKFASDNPNISVLKVDSCRLKVIPNDVQSLSKLTRVVLTNNLLKELPEGLNLLANIKEIVLSFNEFTTFPSVLCKISSLKTVDLSSNKISSFPKNLSVDNKLEVLILSRNQMKSLPDAACNITSLERLELEYNEMNECNEKILNLTQLKFLSLAHNNYSAFPLAVTKLNQLERLDLSWNALSVLPDSMKSMNSLRDLNLSHNRFFEFPSGDVLSGASNLETLSLRCNGMTLVSEEALSHLSKTKLRSLFLSDNKLTEIPSSIGSIESLAELGLEFNKLKKIPNDISQLVNLHTLRLHDNEISPFAVPSVLLDEPFLRQLLIISVDNSLFESSHKSVIRNRGNVSFLLTREKDSSSNFNSESPNSSTRRLSPWINTARPRSASKIKLNQSMRDVFNNSSDTLNSDETPPYARFKDAFESILECEDFSVARLESLKELSVEQKWSFVCYYRPFNHTQLIKADPTKRDISMVGSAKEFNSSSSFDLSGVGRSPSTSLSNPSSPIKATVSADAPTSPRGERSAVPSGLRTVTRKNSIRMKPSQRPKFLLMEAKELANQIKLYSKSSDIQIISESIGTFSPWASWFLEANGLNILIKGLDQVIKIFKEGKANKETKEFAAESIAAIDFLTAADIEGVLIDDQVIEVLISMLDVKVTRVKVETMKVLGRMCHRLSIAHWMISESFKKRFSSKSFQFDLVLQPLIDRDSPPPSPAIQQTPSSLSMVFTKLNVGEESNFNSTSLRVQAMFFINALIINEDNIANRNSLRNNFLRAGLKIALLTFKKNPSEVPDDLASEIELFENELLEDYNELLLLLQERGNDPRLMELLDQLTEVKAYTCEYSQDLEEKVSKDEIKDILQLMVPGQSNLVAVPFHSKTTAGSINTNIAIRFGIEHPEDWGIFLPNAGNQSPSSGSSPSTSQRSTMEPLESESPNSKYEITNKESESFADSPESGGSPLSPRSMESPSLTESPTLSSSTDRRSFSFSNPSGKTLQRQGSTESHGVVTTSNPVFALMQRQQSKQRKRTASNVSPSGLWLNNADKTLYEYGIQGKIFCEFKQKNWNCRVENSNDSVSSTYTVSVDPNSMVSAIMKQLISKRVLDSDSDMNLFVRNREENVKENVKENEESNVKSNNNSPMNSPRLASPREMNVEGKYESKDGEIYFGRHGVWLSESSKLLEYAQFIRKSNFNLHLARRPIAVSIRLVVSENPKSLFFDVDAPLLNVKKHVFGHFFGQTPGEFVAKSIDYGLFMEKQDGSGAEPDGLLDETKPLSCFPIQGRTLRLQLKPRLMTLILPATKGQETDGSTSIIKISVEITKPIGEVLQELCNQFSKTPEDHMLLLLDEEKKGIPIALNPELSLLNQSLPIHASLVLTNSNESNASIKNNSEENENIWAERKGLDIVEEEGKMVAASLNKFVELLTSPSDYDSAFLDTFLLTYLSFTTTETLWSKLVERFNVPESVPAKERSTIQLRVCVFVTHWLKKSFQSLLVSNIQLLKDMWEFIDKQLTTGVSGSLQAVAQGIKKIIGEGLNVKQEENPPPPQPNMKIVAGLSFFSLDEMDIAKHLTLETSFYFQKLKPVEFFNQKWNSEKTKHLAPNIAMLIDQFNRMSRLVATCIVSEEKIRKRTKLLQIFIKVAKNLSSLKNYHMLMAFISGLNNAAVVRQKWTREKVQKSSKQAFETVEEEMKLEGSYKNYRGAIAGLTSTETPCIPYLGVHLQDLVFIEDGNPDTLSGLINWRKRTFIAGVVKQFQQLQGRDYVFPGLQNHVEVVHYISQLPLKSDNELYEMSLKSEPRGCLRSDVQ